MRKFIMVFLFFMSVLTFIGCNVDESVVSISLNPGVDTVEVNSTFTDAGATSTANGNEVDNTVITNTVDITHVGTYEIVYQVEYRNVIKTITRIVSVIDETPPTGTLIAGIDTIRTGDSWVDAGINTDDNSQDTVTVTVSGTVNTNIEGEYHIIYLLEDTSGNQTTITRYVFVYEP